MPYVGWIHVRNRVVVWESSNRCGSSLSSWLCWHQCLCQPGYSYTLWPHEAGHHPAPGETYKEPRRSPGPNAPAEGLTNTSTSITIYPEALSCRCVRRPFYRQRKVNHNCSLVQVLSVNLLLSVRRRGHRW